MLNVTKQTASAVLKGVTMTALLSGVLATTAYAEDAKIKSASFSIQPIYQADEIVVTSSDGKKWDKIDSKALQLSATMKVDTKHPGYVDRIGVFLGACNNTQCVNRPKMFSETINTRDVSLNRKITFAGSKFPVSTTGIALPSYGDEILKGCNSKLTSDGATKSHSFSKLMTASFSANTRKKSGQLPITEVSEPGEYPEFGGGDVTRQDQFAVKITCKPYVAPPMVLKHTNFWVGIAHPKACPRKASVSAEFFTDKAGKIEFMFVRNDGANQKITVNATKQNGEFRAFWSKEYLFSKSVDRKYMISTFGHKYSSEWKPMVIKCGVQNDAPGAGGKTDVPNPTHGNPNDRPQVIVTPKPPKRPVKPGIKVAPLPKVVCIGGKISKNSCFCPARTKKMKFGSNKYRCLNSVVKPKLPPKRVAPKRIAPKAQIKRVAPTRARVLIGKKRRSSALAR